MPGLWTDPLAWVVVGAFLAATALQAVAASRGTDRAALAQRGAGALAWALFAAFWLALVPHFAFTQKSYVEGVLSAAAVPACLYTALLVWRGRESLQVLTRAVAFMGLIYLPFQTSPLLRQWAIEATVRNVEWLIEALGYDPTVTAWGESGYQSRLVLTHRGAEWGTPVVLACTGVGSIAVMAGLVLAVRAPLRRKATALAVVVPVIYGLNLLRAAFIVLAHGKQWFRVFVDEVLFVFGSSDPDMVSYFVSDRIISQPLSVVVLVGLTWGLLYLLPELSTVVEEVAYLATGEEYDVRGYFAGS